MTRKYCDYLVVDTDFIPVFSISKDKDFPDKWKSFLPHDSFKSIVSQLIDTLEMSKNELNRPLWISGAYGTGKTYASIVIKHLLEDELDSVKPYFDTHNMVSLYARLSGVRNRGNILVVHRSSSDSIVGGNRLNNCIRESIKVSLKEKNCSYFGNKSQYDIILSTLKDPDSSFSFAKAFNKHKARFMDYATPESVIRDLENLDLEGKLDLLDTIVEVAEKENYVWQSTTGELIDWIDDVVKGNNLHAVVFIWDEFTEYFKNNQNNITGLQELAMASASIKFYFFLITHYMPSQLLHDRNACKVLEARFKLAPIEMADRTAFKLLAQAIKKNSDLKSEWDDVKIDLWQRVERSAKDTLLKYSTDNVTAGELQDLLPMHPYAAHLLKVISKDISSNQRTMFQFLSGDYETGCETKTNFRWFVDTHSNKHGAWNYLTANFIWDYFFTDENIDFDETFKTVMSHYNNYKSLCQGDTNNESVLKVTLLLTALQQKSGADRGRSMSGLLRPTLSNIVSCFVGTPIQSNIANIMANLVNKKIFQSLEQDGDTLYVPPLGSIDEERFTQMKDEIARNMPFEKILLEPNFNICGRFLPTKESAKQRFIIIPVSTNIDKASVEKAMVSKLSQIPMLFLFAKNETESARVKLIVETLFTKHERCFVIVDFTGQAFGDAAYEKFIHSKTEERYYCTNPNQQSQSNLAKRNAKQIVDEWINKLDMTSLDVYLTSDSVSKCQGGARLRQKMDEICASIFSAGLEQIASYDNLFKPTGFREIAAQMGMSKVAISGANYAPLNQIATKLTNENIWTNHSYFKDYPSHPVSQMKIAVEKVISSGFNANNKVSISEIWDILQKAPFGLQNSMGALFIMGFLLSEYADSKYHKNDGANTVSLNYADLSGLIANVAKEATGIERQFIVKQTPEHMEFCRITGSIFKIAANKQNSIDDIAKYMPVFLTNNGFPLWTLKSFIKCTIQDEDVSNDCVKAIDLLCEFISSTNIIGRDKTKVAEDLYRHYKESAGIAEKLAEICNGQNMKSGMLYYISEYQSGISEIAERIAVTPDEYIIALNSKLSADSSYLWDVGDIDKQINNLYEEYRLIDAVNVLLGEKRNSINKIADAIVAKFNIIKIPETLILEYFMDLNNIFRMLCAIRNRANYNKTEALNIITQDTEIFTTFWGKHRLLFADIVRDKIDDKATVDEIDAVYKNIDSGAFSETKDTYIQNISIMLERHRKDKKITLLDDAWMQKTDTKSPAEWSNFNTIPILCLFQNDQDVSAIRKVLEILNKTRMPKDEAEMDEAISVISSERFEILANINECDIRFKLFFAGIYAPIIDNISAMKNEIKATVGGNVYDWIIKKNSIDTCVKRIAEKQYDTVYKAKVKEKIKELSPERAQKYLEELIEDKPIVGINILQD